ncbi:hypothetical protein C5G87_06860 [Paenibacillus peoriae]|uniref:hypothetical protein n=1 Tax=Paenibacillus peoriae TaxID=59893 RepID=UPI000CEC800C|nr:hypothetical protein [Paenibacillus peoriae]PPQ49090.1 hypothetical protein C5G87_06860 [Paenibacillus peoriae]
MDKKIQEIREALVEATQEDETMTWIHADGEKAIEYISYLLQQIEIKDKALEFYADKENYEERFIEDTNVPIAGGYFSTPKVVKERGNRARTALKGEDTNE